MVNKHFSQPFDLLRLTQVGLLFIEIGYVMNLCSMIAQGFAPIGPSNFASKSFSTLKGCPNLLFITLLVFNAAKHLKLSA